MEKYFLPYELALEMKLIGFDEPCIGVYIENILIVEDDWLFSTNQDTFIESNNFTAPLYQQAFKFFKEEYGLDCYVDGAGRNGKYYAFICGSEHGFLYGNNGNSPSEFTYEGAELACLNKLIEMVKNLKNI